MHLTSIDSKQDSLNQLIEQPIEVLGVVCHAMTAQQIVRFIDIGVNSGNKTILANHNLHSVYLFHCDAQMRSFYDQVDYTHIDGMPILAWAGLLGYSVKKSHRTTSLDWIDELLKLATDNAYKVFFLGSKPGVGKRAADKLRKRHPNLKIQSRHGYFKTDAASDENKEVVRQINAYQPDIVLVGMGMPRQEKWILQNVKQVNTHVFIPVGALMDYIAGTKKIPPRWMGRMGLEWLHRLVHEPARMYKRYLLEPWYLIPLLIQDFKQHKCC
jgi:N-acetylglucosaminyldiphosphoundecaprenol N-acetyl-beta-D-mannosaminyltransferase